MEFFVAPCSSFYTTAAAPAPSTDVAARAAAAAQRALRSLALRARARDSWCRRRRWLGFRSILGPIFEWWPRQRRRRYGRRYPVLGERHGP